LLKGHEDLRQDERVMQLFGLVNVLLATDDTTARKDLSIQRFSITPLSHSAGLVGWVGKTDTLHALIREYREPRRIPLIVEQKLMEYMAPDYDKLPLVNKVEVFKHALANTSGQHLAKVLWLKSQNSEVWLERRRNYTRTLAVMSMVGYILGLGDRHPSNLMLARDTGRVVHIDFGDCFEVAMDREKFPEKIPFRLTRMLVMAMEVSGIEGNFRTTCENVMDVLRTNRDSLMAILEAFVHDPLINWRGKQISDATAVAVVEATDDESNTQDQDVEEGVGEVPGVLSVDQQQRRLSNEAHVEQKQRRRSNELDAPRNANSVQEPENKEYEPEELNERAVAVIGRVQAKLNGRDFNKDETLPVDKQVDRLIRQATSHENLCQCYTGWCAFW